MRAAVGRPSDFIACRALEKWVTDKGSCGWADRPRDGIKPRPEPMASDFLPDAIEKGHFLGHPTTLKLFKEEGLMPGKAVDRASGKVGGGGATDYERAQKVVQDLLALPRFSLPEKTLRELDKVVLADARQYGLEALTALPE